MLAVKYYAKPRRLLFPRLVKPERLMVPNANDRRPECPAHTDCPRTSSHLAARRTIICGTGWAAVSRHVARLPYQYTMHDSKRVLCVPKMRPNADHTYPKRP